MHSFRKIIFSFVILIAGISLSASGQVNADFTVNQQSGCSPHFVQFTDNSTGTNLSYNWDFGNGNTASQANPSNTYSSPGVYTVTLTVTDPNNVSDTETKVNYIAVFANPVASFTVNEDTVCEGVAITFTSTSQPGDGVINQYQWTFNDGTPAVTGTSSVNHSFINGTGQLKEFYPVLLINDANGCNSSISDTIYIFPLPVPAFSFTSTGNCSVPATIQFLNSSQNSGQFNWNFGDSLSGANNTSVLTEPTHTYQDTGNYLVTLTAGVPGCSVSTSQLITIADPSSSFTASDTVICAGSSVNFNSNGSAGSILWNFGDPLSGTLNTSTDPNPVHAYLTPGNYSATLSISAGGCTDVSSKTIQVLSPPVAIVSANDQLGCSIPFQVSFSETGGGNSSWSWNFGDPTVASDTSNLQNPTFTYSNFGFYTVSLTVTDTSGCTNSVSLGSYIQIIEPVIDFVETDSGCVGKTFNFFASVYSPADPVITSYVWDFGDGTGPQTFSSPAASHQYNVPGIFNVSLTITTSTGCTVTLTKTAYIKVGVQPNATITATPTTICFQEQVQFSAQSVTPPVVTAWIWDFGDGSSPPGSGQTVTHDYNVDTSGVADPFDITLYVYNNGCADTVEVVDTITVLGPLPGFAPVHNCSSPLSVLLNNLTGGATSVTWDFGDGSPVSTQVNPTHVFPSRGDYSVTLTATNSSNGCVVDTTLPVRVRIPDANIAANPTSGCFPLTVQFAGSGSQDASTYRWTFGEGIPGVLDTSFFADTLHLYNRPGAYTATLLITDIHGCTNQTTTAVSSLGPYAGFQASPFTGCAPLSVNFTDTSDTFQGNIVSWSWDFGNGQTSTSTTTGNANSNYTAPGNYSVTLTVTDNNGCSSTFTAANYIRPTQPEPIIQSVPNDTVACRNELITFNAFPGTYVAAPITYEWTLGDGSTANQQSFTHSYSGNGSYPVQVIVTDANGCRDTSVQGYFVYTTPASISINTIDTCVEQNGIKKALIYVTIDSDSNLYATNWSWDLDVTTFQQGDSSIFYAYSVPPGNYDVGLTITNSFGCTDSTLIPGAVVVPGPTGGFDFIPDSGCRPLTVSFSGFGNGTSFYSWDFGDGTVLEGTTDTAVTHTYNSDGTFIPQFYLGFQLPVSGSFCYVPTDTAGTVKVTSLLGVNILQDTILLAEGETDTLNVAVLDPNNNPPYTYNWSPFGYVTALDNNGAFLATSTGQSRYYFVNVPYGTGCASYDSVLVIFIDCEDTLKIPNVFTPNDDGKNDEYFLDYSCDLVDFRFEIYNRWGRLIYESTDSDFRWDGVTSNGDEATEGVYYYIMKSRSRSANGWIQLIRN